jgi:DNA-binding MarR family transcriptional regulator
MLGVLSAIERDSAITQRHLAQELGIAVGLANAYVRRCARKGLLKVRQVPLNRYAYYLTPRGFAEKSRLTTEYLSFSLDFFRRARRDCRALLGECEARGWLRVALVGAGDLAEIAILAAVETSVEVVAVFDSGSVQKCVGKPVISDFSDLFSLRAAGGFEALIITDTIAPQSRFETTATEAAKYGMIAERILTPELLRISSRTRPNAGAAIR